LQKKDWELYPEINEENKDKDYLCTGYTCLVTCEPCNMCSMALLHSRIGCVIYGTSIKEGSLGTKCKIHCYKPFNHHFFVYKGFLQKECDALWPEEGNT